MEFAHRLATLRRDRGLTQATLAERAGINISQIRRYEAGASEPSLAALRALATALSVTTDSLVFDTSDRLPADQRLRYAFEATAFLDKHERDTLTSLLEAFLARHDTRAGREGPRAPRARRAKSRRRR